MARGSQHCVGGSDQSHPKKKNCKKTKWFSKEALQITEEREEAEGKGERQRCTQLNAEFQRIARSINR